MKKCIEKKKQWFWFVALWFVGLLSAGAISLFVKGIMKLATP